MWKKPEQPIAIDPSQLVLGLFVWLDLPWDDHPFLYNKFKITSEKQLLNLRSIPLAGKLYYFANKSDCEPGALHSEPTHAPEQPDDTAEAERVSAECARQNAEKQARLRQQKDAAARADRAWEEAARTTREAILGMARSPRQAGEQLRALSQQTASIIAQQHEIFLHLLGDKEGEGPQFHALNVMTLSLLLGKVAGLSEEQLGEIALGALAHDIGKYRVPAHLLKAASRAKHEESFYREHGAYGLELAEISGAFGPQALAAISDHHEALDGTGWPDGKKNLGPAARIVGLVNRYDRLCSPESPERPGLMPAEALACLFRAEAGKYDPRLLSMLIKLLGVYPPGTLVRLSDDSLGLVVSPGHDSLRPCLLIYAPEFDKRDAPALDLADYPDLKIEEALRPGTLPPDVLKWLNPRQRLSYFFSAKKKE